MKTRVLTTIALLFALAFSSGNLFAQRGMGMGQGRPDGPESPGFKQGTECRIPDLTPEQETKIKELRTKHLKDVTPLRNEMQEKRARLNTLKSSDKQDLAAINKVIDEITALKANLMKKQAAHQAEVSALLTDEQRVHFNARQDAHRGERGQGKRMRHQSCE